MTYITTLDHSHEKSYAEYIAARERVRRALYAAPRPFSVHVIEHIAQEHRLLPSTVLEIAIFHKLHEPSEY